MARIEIELPEKFSFQTEIPLRISDINYGGHLSNDAILSLMHEARMQFLKSFGCSELNLFGVSVIQADTVIVYKSEGFYGDILMVDVAVGDLSRVSFDVLYRFTNKSNGKVVAVGKTGILCYNYDKKKVVSIPLEFVKMFGATNSKQ